MKNPTVDRFTLTAQSAPPRDTAHGFATQAHFLASFNNNRIFVGNTVASESTALTADDLINTGQLAIKITFISCCVGGGTAMAIGGPFHQQLLVAGLIAVLVSGSLYWMLCAAARYVAGSVGRHEIQPAAGSVGRQTQTDDRSPPPAQ